MLFNALKNKFGYIHWGISDFNYKGGFGSVCKKLYEDRQKRYEVSKKFFFCLMFKFLFSLTVFCRIMVQDPVKKE